MTKPTLDPDKLLGDPQGNDPVTPPQPLPEPTPGEEFDENPEPDDVPPEPVEPPLDEETKKRREQIQAALQGRLWNPLEVVPKPRSIYTLNGHVWATPGNIGAFSGPSKSGKSAGVGGIIASVLPGSGDTFGFKASNTEGKALIVLDTEQSKYHHSKKTETAIIRKAIKPENTPEWFRSYRLSGISLNLEWLKAILSMEHQRFGGIHSVILDGCGDFLADFNNIEESKNFVIALMALAEQYDTFILCVIHINPNAEGTGKTVGHLGSFIERKSETTLTIKVGTNTRCIYARNARDCSIPEKSGTQFTWSEERSMFVTAGKEEVDGFSYLDVLEALHEVPRSKTDIKRYILDNFTTSDITVRRALDKLTLEKLITPKGNSQRLSTLSPSDKGLEELLKHGRIDEIPQKEQEPEEE